MGFVGVLSCIADRDNYSIVGLGPLERSHFVGPVGMVGQTVALERRLGRFNRLIIGRQKL